MRPDQRPPGHFGVALLLFGRELAARLRSLWLYAIASLICVIAWFYGGGFLRTFETESVLVTTDPLAALNVVIVIVLGTVLGLRLAASLAWEREHRTLEVLIAGSVSYEAVILAKFCVELCLFAVLIAIYALYLVIAQPLGAGVVGLGDAFAVGRVPLHALPMLALGLLVSAWTRTVRAAVITYLAVVIVLALFEAVLGMLAARPPQELSLAATYLRSTMTGISAVIDPVSAVAHLAEPVRGLTGQTPLAASTTVLALALTAITLVLAALAARMRGAI